jgi:methylenetetrahydrofolate--tRNA-(uracil-5-)-methyltransferase
LAGRFAAAEVKGHANVPPPPTTAFGALLSHITGGADARTFQPMNVNFGLFPDLAPGISARTGKPIKIKGKDRKQAMAERALEDLDAWLGAKAAAE